jgi:hypothetical protein
MRYAVAASVNGSFIIVKARGDIERREAVQMILQACALGKKLSIDLYLVDATEAKNVDTVLDTYDFAYSDMVATEGIDRSATVAIVVRPDDHSHDFVETVCRNAGLNFTLFRDRDDARRFLACIESARERRWDRKNGDMPAVEYVRAKTDH